MENYFLFFTSQTFQEALIVPVSFPDIIGALTPTVRTTLVHAIPAFRIAEISRLTHKAVSINNRCRAGFLPFYITSQTTYEESLHNKLTVLSDGYVYMENNS
jgi:hypothetical protein